MRKAIAFVGSLCFACGAMADIDHRLNFDESGIWARSNERAVRYLSAVAVVGGALYEGSDSRLGATFWKASESMIAANVAAEALKRITRRARPSEGNDPNDWFGSTSHKSFPSGEVSHITAVVTPFIAEYAREYPAVWGLAALPVYVGVARMKSQAHWQTDVLAGVALGACIGYYEYTRKSAWMVTVLPRGITVGMRKQF
jgi:undecaprenyl-diphosphatase